MIRGKVKRDMLSRLSNQFSQDEGSQKIKGQSESSKVAVVRLRRKSFCAVKVPLRIKTREKSHFGW